MKKILVISCWLIFAAACTEAGDGSEVNEVDGERDTVNQLPTGTNATTGDTSTYERMPTRTQGDSTVH